MSGVAVSLALAAALAVDAGTLHRTPLAAGWRLAVDGDPAHTRMTAVVAPRGDRVLVVESTSSADWRAMDTRAGIVGADGRVMAARALPGMRPLDAALSPDGRMAYVLAERWRGADDARPVLFAFEAAGAVRWQRNAEPGDRLTAGDGWVALAPPRGGAWETETGDPRAMPAGPRRITPRVFGLDGASLRADDLGMRARFALGAGPAEGRPFASLDGSLLAIGEDRVDPVPPPGRPRPEAVRVLRLLDARRRALGVVKIASGTGIEAALAPDGAAVLATASVIGVGGPRGVGSDALELVMAGRDGTVRWKRTFARRSPGDRVESLGVSAGGRRAVVVLRSGDPARADRVAVLDAAGKSLWHAEGAVQSASLDPGGTWLTLVEGGAIVRARVDDLARGTAWMRPAPRQ